MEKIFRCISRSVRPKGGLLTYCRRHQFLKFFSTATNREVLNAGVRQHLVYLTQQYSELQEKVNSWSVVATGSREDNQQKQKVLKELSSMEPVVKLAEQLHAKESEMADLEAVASSEEEEELQQLLKEELLTYRKELQQIQHAILRALLPNDIADEGSAILEVRAGVGGKEASLFTAEIFQMYQKWAVQRQWKFEILECDEAPGVPGYKHASASVSGPGVFRVLKCERGVHRVQRVPATEAMGRMHTSTTSVAILPQPTEIDVTLNPKELKVETCKSSGPGGQSVNTTDSSVSITHLPTGLTVRIQTDRSQHKNKVRAFQVIRAKLYELKRSEAAMTLRKERKEQLGSGERHERIRTYNFNHDRVTDHRVGLTFNGVQMFMTGEADLDELLHQLLVQEESTNMAALLERHKNTA